MKARHLAIGAGAVWIGYAWVPHFFTGRSIRRGRPTRARVALTFDDGPDPEWTPRILDVLDAQNVRASFFLVGERAERAPDVVRAIAAAGHDVGNHSWSHRSLWLCGPRRTASEIGRTHELLTTLTGREARDFRPPWGMVNAAMFGILHRHHLRCVLWSIQPEGLRPAAPASQVQHVLRHAHAGAIVDLHDAEGTPQAPDRLYEALPAMIGGLRRNGYDLVPLSDLLGRD